jgi:hypothetical protein
LIGMSGLGAGAKDIEKGVDKGAKTGTPDQEE